MNTFADTFRYLLDADHWRGEGGMLALLGQQLLLTFTALVLAVLLGLPLALWLGHLGRGGFLAINISGIGRAVPTFAVLATRCPIKRPNVSAGVTIMPPHAALPIVWLEPSNSPAA